MLYIVQSMQGHNHPQSTFSDTILYIDCSVDALSIYTTYVALNALCPVSMPDEIRQQIEGTQQK